jgi:hypothetical protein
MSIIMVEWVKAVKCGTDIFLLIPCPCFLLNCSHISPNPCVIVDFVSFIVLATPSMPRRNLQNDDSSEDDMTADDLMRLQEDRARKRRRIAADHRPAPATKEGDDSKEEDEGVSRNGDDETQSEESDEDEETLEAEQPSTNSTQGPTYSRIVQSSIVSRTTEEQSETKHAKIKAVTNLSWTDMNIASPLRNALASMSIRAPTEIQSACIPPLLSGKCKSTTVS